MATNSIMLNSQEETDLVLALQQCRERLKTNAGELSLNVSALRRIDPKVLGAIEELAAMAERTGAKVVLQGVHGDVYRAMKSLRLASRFSYAD